LTDAVQQRHAVRWPRTASSTNPDFRGPAQEVSEKRGLTRKPKILFARLGSDQQRQFLCCGADALIRYPRSGSSVVGKSGRALKRIFCGGQRKAALVVFLADSQRIEWNDDGLLVDAQEAADTYHRGSDAAILLDYEIEDVANLVIGRIIYTLFEELVTVVTSAGFVDIKRAECPILPGADCAIGATIISTMIVAAADVSRITITNSAAPARN
jgi:hypothetical protein